MADEKKCPECGEAMKRKSWPKTQPMPGYETDNAWYCEGTMRWLALFQCQKCKNVEIGPR